MNVENHSPRTSGKVMAKGRPAHGSASYMAARKALIAALERKGLMSAEVWAIPKALDRFNKSFERAFVEPLLREATISANPMRGALLMAAAEVMEQLHESFPFVLTSKDRRLGRGDVWEQPQSGRQVETRMKLVDQLIAITRQPTRKQ